MADQFTRTANEELQDRLIRHQLWITRFASKEANDITALLEDVEEDVISRIAKRMRRAKRLRIDTGPVTTKRLKELSTAAHEIIDINHTEARRGLTASLYELSKQEAEFGAGILKKAFPVKLETVLPNATVLRTLVTAEPFAGHALGDWFDGLKVGSQRRLRRSLQVGIASGDTIPQIGSRIREALGVGRRDAAAIARSSVIHTASTARHETFKENSRVIKGIQWTATLDARTCPICMGLDGRVFPLDARMQKPPNHVGCRCTMVPLLKSWKELGINLKEAPQGTRASMGGQVPSKLRYGTWLRQQPIGVQNEALGVARAKLFRSGRLKVQDFTDRRNRILTLDQLARLEHDVVSLSPVGPSAYKTTEEQRKQIHRLRAKKSNAGRKIKKLEEELRSNPHGVASNRIRAEIAELEKTFASATKDIADIKAGVVVPPPLKLKPAKKLPPPKPPPYEPPTPVPSPAVEAMLAAEKKKRVGGRTKRDIFEDKSEDILDRLDAWEDGDRKVQQLLDLAGPTVADSRVLYYRIEEAKEAVRRAHRARFETIGEGKLKRRLLLRDLKERRRVQELFAEAKKELEKAKSAYSRVKVTSISALREHVRALLRTEGSARDFSPTGTASAYRLKQKGVWHYDDPPDGHLRREYKVNDLTPDQIDKLLEGDLGEASDFLDDLLLPNDSRGKSGLTGQFQVDVFFGENTDMRAFASAPSHSMGGRPAGINLARNEAASTIVHELGHTVEYHISQAKLHAQRFLSSRTRGEKASKISPDSHPDEMGLRDKFRKAFADKPYSGAGATPEEIMASAAGDWAWKMAEYKGHYAGRVYAHGSTEILSMGIELLFNDPVGFARRDPQWCKLILGVLDGSL